MDGYPGMVLPGFFPDLVLSGRLPWHGFVWQEFLPFQFLASRGIIQDEFVGQSFSGTGCRAATSAGCILRCLQSKHYSGSDHLYTVKIQFELIKIKVEGFYARNLP